MIKRLALLTLLATPMLHAQVPEGRAVAAPPRAQPLVTYDLVGTFPANAPARLLMAPGAAFLLEISFPQTVPAITNGTFALGADTRYRAARTPSPAAGSSYKPTTSITTPSP